MLFKTIQYGNIRNFLNYNKFIYLSTIHLIDDSMIYNTLGKTGLKVSRLGFGTMRLPAINSYGNINEMEATKMLEYAIENGINLIDTAYPYHNDSLSGRGNGEIFLGNFLNENGLRDEIILQTKSPSWFITKHEDFEFFLNDQLEKLKTDYVDVYLLHSLTSTMWKRLYDLGVLDFLDECLSTGKVNHVGFSSHTDFDTLTEIVEEYPKWEVVLTQMNYLDEHYQTGIRGLEYLKKNNMGNMIMEPLRGGKLIHNVPETVKVLWEIANVHRTPVQWALQYLWNRDDVDCVLSGMSSFEQMKENVRYASTEDIIDEYDMDIIREVARQYHSTSMGNDCTSCGYCMPCPNGVDIVNCFREYNIGKMLQDPNASAMQYFTLINSNSRADSCNDCGECVKFCTQNIDIPKELKKVHEFFGNEFHF